jgi:hypothetical protein
MNTATNPKVVAAKTVLRTRGHKELNEDQMKTIHDLALIEEISAIDIANEVENSPAERTARTIRNVRSKTSSVFQALSNIAKPKEEE